MHKVVFWFKSVFNSLASPLQTMWKKILDLTWKLHFLIHSIISVHFLSSYDWSIKFWVQWVLKKKSKNQKPVFFLLPLVREGNNTSDIVIILPYWLLKKSNAPHEILVSLQTVEKLMVSLKWWFQPHRDLLASVLFPTPLCPLAPLQLYSFLLFPCLQSFSFRILKFFYYLKYVDFL